MGVSNSSLIINGNNITINQRTITILNSDFVKFVASTISSQANQCNSVTQEFPYIPSTQVLSSEQQLIENKFNCIQPSVIRSAIANRLYLDIFNGLNHPINPTIMSMLDANAAVKLSAGFGTWSNSTQVPDVAITYTSPNTIYTNLQYVIQNSIQFNFSSNDIQTCISNLVGSYSGKFNTIIIIKTLSSCSNLQNVANNVISKIIEVLGIGVNQIATSPSGTTQSGTTQSTTTQSESSEDSNNISAGPFTSFSADIAVTAKGIGEGIKSFFTTSLLPYTIGALICCLFFIMILIFIGYKMSQSKNNNNNNK